MDHRVRARIGVPIAVAALIGSFVLSSACSKSGSQGAAATAALALPAGFPSGAPYFARVPAPADWRWLSKAPRSFAMARKWGPFYDLRHADLANLDLTGRGPDLLNAFFDSETKWPEKLPAGYDPAKILDDNRDPGLGLRALHARGISGRGVSVAVVDTPILLDHAEYAGRLRFYGEVNALGAEANFHGGLVASILAGRTCGVAPEAEIYYVGSHNYDIVKDAQVPNAAHYARAVDELLEVNSRLPRDRKIRVISISAGWGPKNKGFKAMNKAVRRAAAAGVFVLSANIFDSFEPGLWVWGFDRKSTESPDDPAFCKVLPWKEWIAQVGGRDRFEIFYARSLEKARSPEFLILPEGSRTVAHPGGPGEYGFYRMGGWSAIVPYIAGLYALACQVRPDITPEVFWRTALATGDPVPIEVKTERYAGKLVNPGRLIEALR